MPEMPARPWRVALVDDSPRYRHDLKAAFEATPGWLCVADWSSPDEALEGVPATNPQLLLLDVGFPGPRQGPEIVWALRDRHPALLIVMLTVSDQQEAVYRSLREGACGYLLKSATWPEILDHAEDALRGCSPMTPSIARKVLAEFARLQSPATSISRLTPAETSVLSRCAQGETEAQIAESLAKSKFTVRAQFRSILNKLNANTRAEAVAKAVHRGWIRP